MHGIARFAAISALFVVPTTLALSSPQSQSAKSPQDPIVIAIQMNFSAINLAKLAQTRTVNSDVKAFADAMVKDHTRTLTQLKRELGVPDSHVRVTAQNQADAERLLKLFGFDFDREFAGQSVSDYQTMVNFLEIQSKGTNNPFAKTARELKSKAIEDMLQAENLRQMLATGTTVPEKGNVYSGRGTPLGAPSTVPSANDGGPIR